MPSQARPPTHSQTATHGVGHAIDPAFTALEFDVKAWINSVFDAAPRHQDASTPTSPNASRHSQTTSPSNANTNENANGALKTSASSASLNADASLDASLDLLQTPALEPVLDDDKNQSDLDGLSTTSSASSTPPTSRQQQQQSTPASASKSQNTVLTQHATTHLTKLHLLAGQTSAALSSTTQDMVRLLPRLTHELDQLRQETKSLQEGIRLVRSDINSVDSADTVQALDRLKYLDLVKTRMEATHSALREAENWRNLEAEANDIFAKGDFTRAATRLSEAERSLVVYKNTNVEGDRMALLAVLKDQLEQQIMGKVKEALEQRDTATCQTLINVFGLIGRQEKFQEYYISQRRAPLIAEWRQLTEFMHLNSRGGSTMTAPGSTADSKDFVSVLQTFYKDASNMLRDEFGWTTSIFSDASATIHSLVQDIFSHIDPSMQAALQYVSRTQGDEGSLPTVIMAFAATESFGILMERIVSQPLVGNQREHSGNRPRAGTILQDNSSKESKGANALRFSFGSDSLEIGSIQDPHDWAYILYEPFMAYQRDYGKLEGAHLRTLLAKSVPSMAHFRDNTIKSRELAKHSSHLVKIMTTTNTLAFNLAEGAIGRCMRLTHGFGAPGLLDGLNNFFKDIMDRYTDILMACRLKSGLQVDSLGGSNAGQSDSGRTARPSSRYDTAEDKEDEDSEGWDDDVTEQDQRLFQMGLRLMVLCRQFCLKLEQLDLKTKKALRGVEDLVKADRSGQDAAASNAASSMEHGSSGSGHKSSVQPPNASIALLQQSNLNSFRLAEILEVVKKSDLKDELAAGAAGDSASTLDRLSPETDLGLEPKANHLFLQSHQRAVHLTRLCQRFIFDSVYIPLVRPLSDVALLPCWSEGIDQQGQGEEVKGARRIHQSTMGGTRTDVIKFRSSPNDYMEELLRQLLGLPLTFGMYEGDVGLRFGIHSLPYADRPYDSSQHQQHEQLEQPSPLVTGVDEDSEDKDNNDLGVGGADPTLTVDKDEARESEEKMAEEDDLAVMHRWITSLSRAAMHTMVERLYNPNLGQSTTPTSTVNTPPSSQRGRLSGSGAPSSPVGSGSGKTGKARHYLTRLSDAGCKQLELDLRYFVDTCLGSLAIEPTPSIRVMLDALRHSEAGLLMALQRVQQQQAEYAAHSAEESSSARTRKTLAAVDAQQVSLVIPGAPVMPSVLVVSEEDILGQLELEQKVLEWVAKLRGVEVPNT
ncbi:hypothetical protein BGZ98_006142 [Dissophora globulifera]|nr:hypothetical protein BGZ98_006142 [Dissophora globulifera]